MANRKIGFFLAPLAIFLVLVAFLLKGLYSDPRQRDSAVVDKTLPPFALNDLMIDNKRWQNDKLLGEAFLLNVWGTWCITCDQELPYLTELRQQGVKIVGLYYDQSDPDFGEQLNLQQLRAGVAEKLMSLGNPYEFNMFDETREMLLDLGVTGAPETYLVDANGIIKVHHLGDVNPRVWQSKFVTAYTQARNAEPKNAEGTKQ
ncbi:MAG: cytochrome c biogenesis protein CcmG/thiol:disulfide interchange protein DsbE [Phenylobacterium sp.]|jgi:cytochrome c biogenesis protein CcmG/thiol:disulfide interchange protein DsbE